MFQCPVPEVAVACHALDMYYCVGWGSKPSKVLHVQQKGFLPDLYPTGNNVKVLLPWGGLVPAIAHLSCVITEGPQDIKATHCRKNTSHEAPTPGKPLIVFFFQLFQAALCKHLVPWLDNYTTFWCTKVMPPNPHDAIWVFKHHCEGQCMSFTWTVSSGANKDYCKIVETALEHCLWTLVWISQLHIYIVAPFLRLAPKDLSDNEDTNTYTNCLEDETCCWLVTDKLYKLKSPYALAHLYNNIKHILLQWEGCGKWVGDRCKSTGAVVVDSGPFAGNNVAMVEPYADNVEQDMTQRLLDKADIAKNINNRVKLHKFMEVADT